MAATMLQSKAEDTGSYTYSSQPRPIQRKKKYRPTHGNIMYDKRIVRGNTYALQTLPASTQPDPLELQRQQESHRRALARKRASEQMRMRSPEPFEGRKHIEVQTELYLEEITDRVEEADIQTQTDAFLDRPPTPLFVPAKTGMDASTQIEEGDLFDFDLEVRPILEVLVGKTVEQALLEVMEEEELSSLRAQQRQFEENRNAELVETQRLEEQERRRREEKERRMQQQREALLKEKETAEKIAARAFAQSYLADLIPSVFTALNEHGFFYDPIEREIDLEFMPWLLDEAEKVLEKKILARMLLDSIIRDVVCKKLDVSKHTSPEPEAPTSAAQDAQDTQNVPSQEKPQASLEKAAKLEAIPEESADSEKKLEGDLKEERPKTAEVKSSETEGDVSLEEKTADDPKPSEPEKTDAKDDEKPKEEPEAVAKESTEETAKVETTEEAKPTDTVPEDTEAAEEKPTEEAEPKPEQTSAEGDQADVEESEEKAAAEEVPVAEPETEKEPKTDP